MKISSYFGKPLSEVQKAFDKMNLAITDTNDNSVFDKEDVCLYTVQNGDSLWQLSQKFEGYKVKDFKENNDFIKNSDKIKPKDIINIPLILGQNKPKIKNNSPLKQPLPSILQEKTSKTEIMSTKKELFGRIKTKKVSDTKVLKDLVGKDIEKLKSDGYYVVDKIKNGKFDEGEELYKQVTIMLDAGHGNGVHLEPNRTLILPNNKKYTTKKDDTLASIAKANNTTEESLKELNPNVRYSKDPGAIPPKEIGSHNEAYLTGVAKDELRKILEQQGFRVVDNIRTDKSHLGDRKKNKLNVSPDMFISLHCDSSENSTATGETVCYNPVSAEDKKFAQSVNSELAKDKTIERNRDMQQRPNLLVLKGDNNGKIAEILVELGFISNKNDYNKLANSDTRRKQLEAIARGVINYYNAEINR